MNAKPSPSFWIDRQRDGFTALCAAQFGVPIPVEDVSDQEVQIVVARRYVHDALIGLQQSKVNVGVLAAAVVSRN